MDRPVPVQAKKFEKFSRQCFQPSSLSFNVLQGPVSLFLPKLHMAETVRISDYRSQRRFHFMGESPQQHLLFSRHFLKFLHTPYCPPHHFVNKKTCQKEDSKTDDQKHHRSIPQFSKNIRNIPHRQEQIAFRLLRHGLLKQKDLPVQPLDPVVVRDAVLRHIHRLKIHNLISCKIPFHFSALSVDQGVAIPAAHPELEFPVGLFSGLRHQAVLASIPELLHQRRGCFQLSAEGLSRVFQCSLSCEEKAQAAYQNKGEQKSSQHQSNRFLP